MVITIIVTTLLLSSFYIYYLADPYMVENCDFVLSKHNLIDMPIFRNLISIFISILYFILIYFSIKRISKRYSLINGKITSIILITLSFLMLSYTIFISVKLQQGMKELCPYFIN